MNAFADLMTEDRRSVILRLLEKAPDYRGNCFLLQTALAGFGHSVGMDRLNTDLCWLGCQGYLTLETIGEATLARLTQSGLDVATGRSVVPGVKRPSPEA
jgi:hypothetical protein